jgi:WD40 repeat protein
MFLASDRLGTLGALDLWVATRARTSDPWSAPVNVGAVVNTTQIEARPALSSDGRTLYFQATRPGAVGCASGAACIFDFWVTTRTRLHDADHDDDDGRVGTRWEEKQR